MKVTFDLTLDEMNDINECINKAIHYYKTHDKTKEDELKMNELVLLRRRLFEFHTDDVNRIHFAI